MSTKTLRAHVDMIQSVLSSCSCRKDVWNMNPIKLMSLAHVTSGSTGEEEDIMKLDPYILEKILRSMDKISYALYNYTQRYIVSNDCELNS